MKILVPVDGSPASMNAVEKALEIAKKYGFSMKIISSVSFDKVPRYRRNEKLWSQAESGLPETMMTEEDEIAIQLKKKAADLLESIPREFDFTGVELEKELLFGDPYEKILETAKNGKFDLIVMGNRGFSKIKRFFVGSVTQRVISEAPCPVLVIHAEAEEE